MTRSGLRLLSLTLVELLNSTTGAERTRAAGERPLSMADHDRKKSKGERAAEREAAKQLLLETNILRVFSILAGFNLKQPLGEKKERLEKNLKQLKSMVDTERAAFGVLGPKRTPEEIKEEIARCTEKLRAVRMKSDVTPAASLYALSITSMGLLES